VWVAYNNVCNCSTADFSQSALPSKQTISRLFQSSRAAALSAPPARIEYLEAQLAKNSGNSSDPDSTAILYPARVKDYLDWEMVNKLASMKNSDFREFLKSVMNALKIKKVLKDDYDRIFSKDELIANINAN